MLLAGFVLAPAVVDQYAHFMLGIPPGRLPGDVHEYTVMLSPDGWQAVAIFVALYIAACWQMFSFLLDACEAR